jgi:hypothetical protein
MRGAGDGVSLKGRITGLPGVGRARATLGLDRPTHPRPDQYHKAILTQRDGAEAVRSLLLSGRPALAARIGGMELDCIVFHLYHRCRVRKRAYPEPIRRSMRNNTGFFPITDDALDAFCRWYLAAIGTVDVMGVWFNVGEDRVVRAFCPEARLVPLRSIEPYYLDDPWSRELRGRKVLVVHPFAETIRDQYETRRSELFDDPDVLPPFQLRLVRAVQSAAGETPDFSSWFEALSSMEEAMDAVDYDVCIIGAGAYGLPLGAHARRRGKVAIHMGGATQILFGIRGRRWNDHEIIGGLYRGSWVQPRRSEVPCEAGSVEDGCYW